MGRNHLPKTARRFFVIGIGAFSGVTTLLFPLSVIKTVQQASHGGQTTAQITSMIWKTRGIAGFYRGYFTVVMGFIPARMVYLSSLEFTKSAVSKAGQQLGVDETVLSGSANFAAGGLSSLITQFITVPMDVISQRQMVHTSSSSSGGGGGAGGAGGSAGAAGAAGASTSAPRDRGVQAGARAGAASIGQSVPSSSASSSSTSGQPRHVHTSASQQPQHLQSWHPHQRALHALACNRPGAVEAPSAFRAGGSAASHAAATVAAHAGVDAASSPGPRPHGVRRQPQNSSPTTTTTLRGVSTSASLSSGSASAAAADAAGPSAVRNISALQIVRVILKEEGVMGLYRGFGASIAVYVPSSAVWWGCYGLYQKIAWSLLGNRAIVSSSPRGPADPPATGIPSVGTTASHPHQPSLAARTAAKSGASVESGAALPSGTSEGPAAAAAASTLDVMAVQTLSACLSGVTSAILTSPLDLIKTRIQVAQKQQGQAMTFRTVFAEVVREDGWSGLFRAAGPRALNSALWGTMMMTVYEGLKRVSVKE